MRPRLLGPGSAVDIQGRSALLDPLADYRDDTARQRVREEFAERHLRPIAGGRRGQLLIKVAAGRIAGSDESAAAEIRRRSRLSDEILPRLTSHKIQRSSITVTAEAVEIEDLLNPGEGDGVGASIGADRGAGICRQSTIGGARVNRVGWLSAATRDERQKKSRARSTQHRGDAYLPVASVAEEPDECPTFALKVPLGGPHTRRRRRRRASAPTTAAPKAGWDEWTP